MVYHSLDCLILEFQYIGFQYAGIFLNSFFWPFEKEGEIRFLSFFIFSSFSLEKKIKNCIVSLVRVILGNRLMVGHRTLTPFVQVRILVPQGVWLRSRETVSRRAHNPKIGGSIPSSATKLIGSSLIGRASDSESEGYRFESYLPSILI